jgi:RNA polymerase sigma-70 factor, ECF subfamily
VRLVVATAQVRDQRWDVLVRGMARGDSVALASLYDATAAPVHALVTRIVKDDAMAEEVTGDVYLQAWQQAARYDAARGSALAWLLAIARTRAIDRIRVGVAARAAHEPVERAAQMPCARPGPEDACAVDERRRHVHAALACLPPEQRQALELSYFDGLSHGEIAARLEQPLGTVKTRIRLAMSKLRDVLAALGSRT